MSEMTLDSVKLTVNVNHLRSEFRHDTGEDAVGWSRDWSTDKPRVLWLRKEHVGCPVGGRDRSESSPDLWRREGTGQRLGLGGWLCCASLVL